MSTIQKRNQIHKQLAEHYARMTGYIGGPGNMPCETESHEQYVSRTRREYETAVARSVPQLRAMIASGEADIAATLAATRQRRIGEDGEVRCGDVMHDGCHVRADGSDCGHSRRLCGGCATIVDHDDGTRELSRETGCGDVLERRA